jgi:hypothetical protein
MAYQGWPTDQADHLQRMLRSGESILWQGRPERGPYILRRWPQSCFGVFFLGFALFWTATAFTATHAAPDAGMPAVFRYLFPLFGVPFVLVGAGLTFGQYIVAAAEWPNVEYALTNQRVLIRTGRTPTVTGTELTSLASVTASGAGSGSVSFTPAGVPQLPVAAQRMANFNAMHVGMAAGPVFECIRDPQQVYMLAQDAIQKAAAGKG